MKEYLTRPVILCAVGFGIVIGILYVVLASVALLGIGVADMAVAGANRSIGYVWCAIFFGAVVLFLIAPIVFGWLAARSNISSRMRANLPLTTGFCAASGAVAVGLGQFGIGLLGGVITVLFMGLSSISNNSTPVPMVLFTIGVTFTSTLTSTILIAIFFAALGALGGAMYLRTNRRKTLPAVQSAEPT